MTPTDLLVHMIKTAVGGDQLAFRKAVEGLIQEEEKKGHRLLAKRFTDALRPAPWAARNSPAMPKSSNSGTGQKNG
jgi:hypothetical protein